MNTITFYAVKSAILFAAIVITLLISLMIPTWEKNKNDQVMYRDGIAHIITTDGSLVSVQDTTINVDGAIIKDEGNSAAVITKEARIPAALPNTACGTVSDCIYDASFAIAQFVGLND